MLCEERALCLDGARASEQFLCWERSELVTNGVAAVWVLLGRVNDLEDAMVGRVSVETGGAVDDGLADLVEVAVGICLFVPWRSVGFFVQDSVFVTVNGGINT
jgi:hypothetical protein